MFCTPISHVARSVGVVLMLVSAIRAGDAWEPQVPLDTDIYAATWADVAATMSAHHLPIQNKYPSFGLVRKAGDERLLRQGWLAAWAKVHGAEPEVAAQSSGLFKALVEKPQDLDAVATAIADDVGDIIIGDTVRPNVQPAPGHQPTVPASTMLQVRYRLSTGRVVATVFERIIPTSADAAQAAGACVMAVFRDLQGAYSGTYAVTTSVRGAQSTSIRQTGDEALAQLCSPLSGTGAGRSVMARTSDTDAQVFAEVDCVRPGPLFVRVRARVARVGGMDPPEVRRARLDALRAEAVAAQPASP